MSDQQHLARFGDGATFPPAMGGRLRLAAVNGRQLDPETIAECDAAEHAADVEAHAERYARQQAYRTRIWAASCPVPFRGATLAGLEPSQNPHGVVTAWLDGPAQTLLLHGPQRRGKSHAAYAVGNAARDRDLYAAGFTAAGLLAALRPSQLDPARPELTRQHVTEADVLIIDDLGVEKHDTDWAIGEITDVLNTRIDRGGRLVVTTNLTDAELVGAYGDRIVYRLIEAAVIVKVDGPIQRPRPRT